MINYICLPDTWTKRIEITSKTSDTEQMKNKIICSTGTSIGRENNCDYRPFISYFLDQLFLCYRELNLNLGTEMGRRKGSDALESFLRMCTIHVSKRDLCSMVPDISESTVSRVLKRMCDSGELMRIGGSKSTRYVRVKK